MGSEPKLTNRQRMFIEHYIQCWNATEAARRAGYSGNDATLGAVGYENLRKPQISELIEKRISEEAMSANEVLLRLGRMARGSLEPFLDTGSDLAGDAPKYDLSTEKARANLHLIKRLKTKTVTRIKEGDENEPAEGLNIVEIDLEIHDPKDALVHLGRHHKLFVDRIEQDLSGLLKIEKHASELTDDELATLAARGRERTDKTP